MRCNGVQREQPGTRAIRTSAAFGCSTCRARSGCNIQCRGAQHHWGGLGCEGETGVKGSAADACSWFACLVHVALLMVKPDFATQNGLSLQYCAGVSLVGRRHVIAGSMTSIGLARERVCCKRSVCSAVSGRVVSRGPAHVWHVSRQPAVPLSCSPGAHGRPRGGPPSRVVA